MTPNHLSILADLTDLLADASVMQFADARVNENLALLFRLLPKDHAVWRLAEEQEREREAHRKELLRYTDALCKIGLGLYLCGGEIVAIVEDETRLAQAPREYLKNLASGSM